ncbi:MAG TPA: hypothetical protein VK549_02315 [Acidimicrobiia bacterium]|nr:hypothetical protein [Acidimicrobiia bacterium]
MPVYGLVVVVVGGSVVVVGGSVVMVVSVFVFDVGGSVVVVVPFVAVLSLVFVPSLWLVLVRVFSTFTSFLTSMFGETFTPTELVLVLALLPLPHTSLRADPTADLVGVGSGHAWGPDAVTAAAGASTWTTTLGGAD